MKFWGSHDELFLTTEFIVGTQFLKSVVPTLLGEVTKFKGQRYLATWGMSKTGLPKTVYQHAMLFLSSPTTFQDHINLITDVTPCS